MISHKSASIRLIRLIIAGAIAVASAAVAPTASLASTLTSTTSTSTSLCPPNKKPPPYPPGRCHLTVSATTIADGGTVQVSGSGYHASTVISFTLDPGSIAIGTLSTDITGAVNGSITIPSNVAPGSYSDMKASGMDPNGFGYALWSDPVTITKTGLGLAATSAAHHRSLTTPAGLAVVLLLAVLGSGLGVRSRRRDVHRHGTPV